MKKGIHPENYRPVVFKDMLLISTGLPQRAITLAMLAAMPST